MIESEPGIWHVVKKIYREYEKIISPMNISLFALKADD
jgi:hypothetical protein